MIGRYGKAATAAILTATGFLGGTAEAGIFRAYLSLAGNDLNPCTLPQPCRLLPAALAAVNDGGEIWMLDSANFNTATVAINKSLTILAVPGALGSIVANNSDAISISAPGAKVTLRNLVILNLAGVANNGISFSQGAALTLEGCELYGLNNGLTVTAAGANVTVKETTIRDNNVAGISIQGAKMQVRAASLLNNGQVGLSATNGATVTVSASTVSASATGVAITAAGSNTTQVTLSGSTVAGNTTGIQVTAASPADSAQVVLSSSTLTQNGTGVALSGATATAFSRQNNTLKFNTTDVSGGGMTSLSGQ